MSNFDLPAAFEAFADARKAGFLKVKAAKEQGKKVAGCFCAFTPLEILDAADLLTVSLCGMSPETIPAAETELPRNLCPLIKSSYGFYLTAGTEYLAFILFTTITTYLAAYFMGKRLERQDAYLAQNKAAMSRDERKEYKAKIIPKFECIA